MCALARLPRAPDELAAMGGEATHTWANIWAHLGDASYKPHGFEAQLLTTDHERLTDDISEAPGELRLSGQWQFQNLWRFVKDLVKTAVWSVRFFLLVHSQRPLGNIVPSTCYVREMPALFPCGTRVHRFWDGTNDCDNARKRRHDDRSEWTRQRLQKEAKVICMCCCVIVAQGPNSY